MKFRARRLHFQLTQVRVAFVGDDDDCRIVTMTLGVEESFVFDIIEPRVIPIRIIIARLTRRNREVINFTRSRVKTKSKLTNFGKLTRIEGYNGK